MYTRMCIAYNYVMCIDVYVVLMVFVTSWRPNKLIKKRRKERERKIEEENDERNGSKRRTNDNNNNNILYSILWSEIKKKKIQMKPERMLMFQFVGNSYLFFSTSSSLNEIYSFYTLCSFHIYFNLRLKCVRTFGI